MGMAKIRRGDTVIVLAGKDKGREGEVLKVLPRAERVVVRGVNTVVRHTKPTQANPEGGLNRFEAPVHISNVALKDPQSGKPTRVGITVKDGKKVRIAKSSNEVLDD